ncbi:unnamed protein product [Soboliphyme baturini]|uniref:Tex_N domain-containing protein n=1 Tax=Soboliphyme baturini TaxID=241478 RepID=A0A183J4U9_9BILA|nr:unnamed protein product [Soboliphyme baturini]
MGKFSVNGVWFPSISIAQPADRFVKSGSNVAKPQNCFWTFGEYLEKNIGPKRCQWDRLSELFASGNSLPFIARYRQEVVKELDVDDLRYAQRLFEKARDIDVKVGTVIKKFKEANLLTEDILCTLKSAITVEEVTAFSDTLKTEAKHTLAQRAEIAGLRPPALAILNGNSDVNIMSLVNKNVKGKYGEFAMYIFCFV